jgi:hypothetical protein
MLLGAGKMWGYLAGTSLTMGLEVKAQQTEQPREDLRWAVGRSWELLLGWMGLHLTMTCDYDLCVKLKNFRMLPAVLLDGSNSACYMCASQVSAADCRETADMGGSQQVSSLPGHYALQTLAVLASPVRSFQLWRPLSSAWAPLQESVV